MRITDEVADFIVGDYCPVITFEWLEERYGAEMAQTIYEEIQRTDQKARVANDTRPAVKAA